MSNWPEQEMSSKNHTSSVVIPTYNRAETLPRAIDSVLEQTHDSFELIVVDDGSTDHTPELLDEYDDPRLTVERLNKNRGAAGARNVGIRRAEGDYISFLDSDDEWHPEMLEQSLAKLGNAPPKYGAVYSFYIGHFPYGKRLLPNLSRNEQKEGNLHEHVLCKNFLAFSNITVRSSCFEQVGYLDESLPQLHDWDFHIRFSERFQYRCIRKPMLDRYVSDESMSSRHDRFIELHETIRSKHRTKFQNHQQARVQLLFRLGASHCLNTNPREGRTYLRKALQYDPLNTVYLCAYVASFLGTTCFEWGWSVLNYVRALRDRIRIKRMGE